MLGERGVSEDIGEEMVNIDIAEESRQSKKMTDDIAARLELYENDIEMLTKQYTELLLDDNVVDIFTKITHTDVFARQMPEFYNTNKLGESVINCQQNSSYHRYGVFRHVLYSVEVVGKDNKQLSIRELKLLKWTMFLHDIGKAEVKTVNANGNDSFEGHDDKSVEISQKVLDRFYFTEDEKRTILTLIKYHDRYLNDGELTFDNMSFLAQELENKKDLFYLLIEVKIADSKAKTIDVYNRFMSLIVDKYYDFANKYFSDVSMSKEEYLDSLDEEDNMGDIISGNDITTDIDDELITGEVTKQEKSKMRDNNKINKREYKKNDTFEEEIFENIEERDFESIYKEMLNRRNIYPVYQIIVNVAEKKIHGYESFNRIAYTKNIRILDVIKKSKDFDKYDKVEQIMFINSLDLFAKEKHKYTKKLFTNIDINSYQKYVNKPRVYDLLDKSDTVIEIDNYTQMDIVNLQKTINELRKAGANILLNHFGSNSLDFTELDKLKVEYIKYDLTMIKDFEEDQKNRKFLNELSTYCLSRDIKLVVIGVETLEQLRIIKDIGINYVQGYLFGKPSIDVEISNTTIEEVFKRLDEDNIV